MSGSEQVELTPGKKFVRALVVGFLLAIPIFAVWLMIGDRQSQSAGARQSIAAGWGGPQTIAGPELSIPFKQTVNTTEQVNGTAVTHTATIDRRLILAPSGVDAATVLLPERRSRSIYDVVIYRAQTRGRALFQLPSDLATLGVQPGSLQLARAEIRFGVSDARGLSANPDVRDLITIAARPSLGEHLGLLRKIWRGYDLAASVIHGDRPTIYAWAAGKFRVGIIVWNSI